MVKNPPANAEDLGSVPGLGKKRKWHPTPVFLPGKSRGQRYLMGYSPWGRKRVRHDLVTKQQQQPWGGGGGGCLNLYICQMEKVLPQCCDD